MRYGPGVPFSNQGVFPATSGRADTAAFGGPFGAVTVFDIGAGMMRANENYRGHHQDVFGRFRNRDDRPPGKSVTAKLLGDPAPDRVVPEIPEETGSGCRRPSPIHLTFREMRAAHGED